MKNIIIDMWYNYKLSDADKVDVFFSDCDCVYRGNFYKNGKMIGDYTAKTFQAIEAVWKVPHDTEIVCNE